MDHPLPWLRYAEADDLDDDSIDFDGMNVQGATGDHLGDVDGFIVDSQSGRPYYVVVDAAGWFKSKHFLLPVGHVRFDADGEALIADIGRDRVDRFPGFDKDEFEKMSVDDLKRLNDDMCQACSIEGVAIVYASDEPWTAAWDRPDYRYPDWWSAAPYHPDRMGARAVTAGAETSVTGSLGAAPIPATWSAEREQARMQEADPSPHPGGRAQPGDVIGVETGGERTYIGDTAEDENERRRAAEEINRKGKD